MHSKYDRDGKLMVQLHDIRGAIVTANATLTTGTATSLLTGDADKMLDLIEMTCANNSSVGATVALINEGTTIRNINIPAYGTVQLVFDTPLEQLTKNTPWNVDMNDITGTTVSIGALFIKREK